MAILAVNPTRMEQSTLKKRLVTAKRGHKLLKDKQDELMRRFIEKVRENKKMRDEVEKELTDVFHAFVIASSEMSQNVLEAAVALPKEEIYVDIVEKNVMSVIIPEMHFVRSAKEGIFPYGFAQTSAELDDAIYRLNDIMERLLALAEVEKSCELMADEIEKTRRRVNALEYRTIPDLEDTIRFIRMKLDENERATITRLMKVKDIIAKTAS